jgi:hypothetical protein
MPHVSLPSLALLSGDNVSQVQQARFARLPCCSNIVEKHAVLGFEGSKVFSGCSPTIRLEKARKNDSALHIDLGLCQWSAFSPASFYQLLPQGDSCGNAVLLTRGQSYGRIEVIMSRPASRLIGHCDVLLVVLVVWLVPPPFPGWRLAFSLPRQPHSLKHALLI